jgi:putative Ca2+/H+ antiporter (TMEM165/GDT1 family)
LAAGVGGAASQSAPAGLGARHDGALHAVATGLGAWLALVTVAAIAMIAGRVLVRRVPVRLVQRVAGAAFALFAVLAGVAAATG